MKKITNLNHPKERPDRSKLIYKSISDCVKTLDDARGCAHQIRDLFALSTQIHRSKLQEYCERLIFTVPLTFGLRAEELLWRKAYYEVLARAKLLKQQEYTVEEQACIINLINAGIGHYHHYILRLQTEYEVSVNDYIDFSIRKPSRSSEAAPELLEWCRSSIHRSLIYLGDLYRYKLEIYSGRDTSLAIRYYSQALLLKPDAGMPHNQMGTLAASLNQHLDATFHYIQCMMSKHSFDGTENNLHRLFEKNSQYLEQLPIENPDADVIIQLEPPEHVRRFIARFLLLADVWFFNKNIPHIYDLCHQTNVDLQECLSFMRPTEGSQNGDASFLSGDMIFKIVVICLQCITKLQHSNNSHQLSNVIAFTLAVYSQLIQHITARLHESILNVPCAEDRKQQRKNVFSRRRKKLAATNSDDESEESEAELNHSESGESENEENPIQLPETTSEEEEEEEEIKNGDAVIDEENGKCREVLEKLKSIAVVDLLDIIAEETYFQSVKVLSDWLRADVEVLRNCGRSTRSLFVQLVDLFNLISIDVKKLKLPPHLCKTPLSEDLLLRGMEILTESHKQLDWQQFAKMVKLPLALKSTQYEVLVRINKLLEFAQFLEQHHETGVRFERKSRKFRIDSRALMPNDESPITIEELEASEISQPPTTKTKHERDTKRQLMKNMGQLWLAAEVRDLESRVKGKMSLSPYLVVDVDALIKHMDLVKHLVYSRKFLILVPTAVLCALDDLKKSKSEAREAIRWLESQFRQGNRFFRPQRHHERLALPLIKYPKKKDKEAVIYIQIIECCYYLGEQQEKRGGNMVTLLSGDANALSGGRNEAREFSSLGLAQSAGVSVELISEFYVKWKKTTTSKGKNR